MRSSHPLACGSQLVVLMVIGDACGLGDSGKIGWNPGRANQLRTAHRTDAITPHSISILSTKTILSIWSIIAVLLSCEFGEGLIEILHERRCPPSELLRRRYSPKMSERINRCLVALPRGPARGRAAMTVACDASCMHEAPSRGYAIALPRLLAPRGLCRSTSARRLTVAIASIVASRSSGSTRRACSLAWRSSTWSRRSRESSDSTRSAWARRGGRHARRRVGDGAYAL